MTGRNGVQFFNSEGILQKKLKILDDPFNCIISNKMWVVSSLDNGLCLCNEEGVAISQFTSLGTDMDKVFSTTDCYEWKDELFGTPMLGTPAGLAITQSEHFLICDTIIGRIWLLSSKGRVIANYGNGLIVGSTELTGPMGIASFSDGRVIVTEPFMNRIQLLR